ncbi:hypothetical protein DM02DRAFT_656087 [Periconia macrospinosa]|uniref:Rhodopsin domain-containing protein n=1 Tax=Periconia macrospinosa TaxID=97972 RepID=A0A2V1DPB1_9PLEO|nr:hypothetical protein DM02DRAFT_656087 [Periconia macrospinosa]
MRADSTESIIISVIACMVLSGFRVIGRFASRFLKKTPIGVRDWLILGGLAGAFAISIIIIQAAKRGLGKHVEIVGLAGVRQLLLYSYIGEIFYSISFLLIKMSTLFFYRQIFGSRFMNLATTGISIFVVL